MGKSTISTGPFSIAMWLFTRGYFKHSKGGNVVKNHASKQTHGNDEGHGLAPVLEMCGPPIPNPGAFSNMVISQHPMGICGISEISPSYLLKMIYHDDCTKNELYAQIIPYSIV